MQEAIEARPHRSILMRQFLFDLPDVVHKRLGCRRVPRRHRRDDPWDRADLGLQRQSGVTLLGVTHPLAPKGFGGLAIGLTLVVIHLVGINITGTSVNPARSIGPAMVGIGSNPGAVAQLWLFISAPLIGGGAAGLLFRTGALLDVPNKA